MAMQPNGFPTSPSIGNNIQRKNSLQRVKKKNQLSVICFFLPIFTNINYWYKLVTFFFEFPHTDREIDAEHQTQPAKQTENRHNNTERLSLLFKVDKKKSRRKQWDIVTRVGSFALQTAQLSPGWCCKKNLFKKKGNPFRVCYPLFHQVLCFC